MKATLEKTQILRDLAKNPHISQREIAVKNGMSLGKVNYAIQSLIAKGFVKLQNFRASENKRKYMYILTPEGMYEKTRLTTAFLKWKMEEYERIRREIAELEAEIGAPEQQEQQ
ncbi:MAG TPA: MarR family EPS-associated transcriptional regulator [Syntrophales bacterium]|nr:MarR family EPS-associated transcriptional regulator [Syntrophales bacterium]HON24052.1 MarR family EPS-associated transcriptional regulator [Syntrophales bacterium]HOU78814.1 MarR family EPS-associated transcriptional regulator [Syntrophales bacterium]HQJ31215.1 MarR family EPS-associated transcriptional regulator [Syntrophales bacterium]